jgi:hypothetical protein
MNTDCLISSYYKQCADIFFRAGQAADTDTGIADMGGIGGRRGWWKERGAVTHIQPSLRANLAGKDSTVGSGQRGPDVRGCAVENTQQNERLLVLLRALLVVVVEGLRVEEVVEVR